MPLPKKSRRPQCADTLAGLDESLRADLETGCGILMQYDSLAAMQEDWDVVGNALTAEFTKQHPGERPFGWWLFEHNEERPLNPGSGAEPEFIKQLRNRSRFGFLHSRIWLGTLTPVQEDETLTLQRLGLLSQDELQRIPIEEPDDETISMGLRISRRMCRGPRLKPTTNTKE